MTEISSAAVTEMVDHSAILDRLNANERRGRWLLWIGYPAAIASLSLVTYGVLIGVIIVALSHILRNWLPSRSPVEFEYIMDDEQKKQSTDLGNSLRWLASSHALWQIDAFGNTYDWKRNAGANQLVRRSSAKVGSEPARSFTTNVEVSSLHLKRETIYFLPDMILIKQAGVFGSITYANLQVAQSLTNFREEGTVPNDAKVVGSTWRYVNKDGGPDRRFGNNRQIPIARYGQLALRSSSGLQVALMTSSDVAAQYFAAGLRYFQSSLARSANPGEQATKLELPPPVV